MNKIEKQDYNKSKKTSKISIHQDNYKTITYNQFVSFSLPLSLQVKVWRVCDPGVEQPVSATVCLNPGEGRLELLRFHPHAAGLLAVGSGRGIQVWDTSRDKALAGMLPQPTHPHTHLTSHSLKAE